MSEVQKRSKIRTATKYLVLSPLTALFALIILALIVLFWTGYTTYGTKTVINMASKALPELALEGVEGTLLDDLKIKHITWQKDDLTIHVEDAELDTSPFPPRITLHKLSAKRITLELPEADKTKTNEPFVLQIPDINIPIDLILEDINVDELHIQQGEALIKLRDVKLSGLVDKDDVLKLDNLSGSLYDDAGNIAVTAKGLLGLASPHAVDLSINATGDSQRLGVGSVDLKATGEVIDYQLAVNGNWKYADYPRYQLEMMGKGNLEQLDVENLDLTGDAGSAHLQGIMSWSPKLNWDLELTGDDLNPAAFLEQLPGNLDMVWQSTGTFDEIAKVQLTLKSLTGQLQDYPVDAQMLITIEGDQGTLESLNTKVGDNQLSATGTANEQIDIQWQLDAPLLSQLHPTLTGKLKGNGLIRGKRDGSQFQLAIETLKGKVLDYPVEATGGIGLDGELASAENLKLSVGNNHLTLDGNADEQKGINWSLDAKKLSQIAPDLNGSLKGSGKATGLLDGSRGAIQIDNLKGKIQDYPINAKGKLVYKDQHVEADQLKLAVGNNRVQLQGSTASVLDWKLDAQNLKQLYPDISGFVKGHGKLAAKLDGSSFKVNIAQLDGKIDGRPLKASGDVESLDGVITVKDLVVLAGQNKLNASGNASEPFDLNLDIDAPKLSQVWPGLAGSLKGGGKVSGTLKQLQVNADLKGKQLKFDDLSINGLDLTAKQQGDVYDIKADITQFKQGANTIKTASLNANGRIDNHTANLAVDHNEGKLSLSAAGGWINDAWQGTLNKLDLLNTQAGNWRLNKPVAITASAKAAKASQLCLSSSQNGRLCTEAQWSEIQGVTAKGDLIKVPLALSKPWLPDNINVPGMVNADFDITQQAGVPNGTLSIKLPDSSITIQNKRGKKETLYYSNTAADMVINNKKATIKASADLRDRGQLRAEGSAILADNPQNTQLDANIKLNVPDIRWAQQFSNVIDELKGKFEGDVRIEGTLAKPKVTGTAKLQNASLYLPETGARIEAINLTAQADRADQMAISGTLKAGTGVLNANGTLYLQNLPKWNADLTLKGDRLLLMNTYEVQAQASPDLVIKASPDKVRINGTIVIPETTITLEELPPSAKSRSDDIVIVGKASKQEIKQEQANDGVLDIYPNVEIVLGDKITFSGFGLDAGLTGKLRILRTRQDIVAQGALNIVDGVYEAYGQELEIERGRLLFDGPVNNPGLDVRAVRRVPGDIMVGIALSGTANNPESELFSTPQQTQTDTLSYLLTGRSLSNSTSGDTAILTKAVTGLGIRGGESLAQQMGSQLGLDVGIDTNGGDYKQSELALGKRIGTNLYIKYIVGIFDSLQKVAVTYQINKRLELEAKSGIDQQSLNLNYKIETNKGIFGR